MNFRSFLQKKYFIIATILFLAAGCGKQAAVLPLAGQNVPLALQTSSSSPVGGAVSGQTPAQTQTAFAPKPEKITLAVYTDPAGIFSINYTSDFKLFNSVALTEKSGQGENLSACTALGGSPSVCFVLKGAPYKPSNLTSSAVSIRVRDDKKTLSECGAFPTSELGFGHLTNPVMINNSAFVTALSDKASGGKETQVKISRAYFKNVCYEINEAITWENITNPPRQEVDKEQLWTKLDAIRGNFRFIR